MRRDAAELPAWAPVKVLALTFASLSSIDPSAMLAALAQEIIDGVCAYIAQCPWVLELGDGTVSIDAIIRDVTVGLDDATHRSRTLQDRLFNELRESVDAFSDGLCAAIAPQDCSCPARRVCARCRVL